MHGLVHKKKGLPNINYSNVVVVKARSKYYIRKNYGMLKIFSLVKDLL